MTDSLLTIKNDSQEAKRISKRAAGSLAGRILIMSIALLGLPLLIHTFFLYHREYRENVDDALLTMRSLAESRALYIEQMIENQQTILEALSKDLPLSELESNEYLNKEAKEYELDDLFSVHYEKVPICDRPLCNDPTFQSVLEQSRVKKSFDWMRVQEGQESTLYVGSWVNSTNQVLVIGTKISHILTRLAYQEYSPYPLQLSFVDKTGTIFLSSSPEMQGKKFGYTQPNSYVLENSKEPFLAVQIPIEGTEYSLMLGVPTHSIATLQLKDYFFRIASLLLLVCLVGGGLLVWLTHRMAKPLRSLSATMQRVAQGGTHTRFTPDKMGFEINVLGGQMNQMLDSLQFHQQEAEKERIARERLAEELRIGHEIQSSMLPIELPDFPSLEIAPGYLAAREVSGDFYDLFILEDGRLLIAIADAADKGISACLFSLSFRSMLRMAAANLKDLSSIVQMANELLLRDTEQSCFFITAWIGIYNPKNHELDYCSQGHPPAYIRRQNREIQELSAGGMALGIQSIQPIIHQIKLNQNDILLIYTDGVIEATDSENRMFGKEKLKEFLSQDISTQAKNLVEQLLMEIHSFTKDAVQSDDLTLLAMRVKNSSLL